VPRANAFGTFSVSWTVVDDAALPVQRVTRTSTVTVDAVNDLPRLVSRSRVATVIGRTKSGTFSAVDDDGDPVTFSQTTLASIGAVTVLGSGAFQFVPPATAGTGTVQIQLSDGVGGSTIVDVGLAVIGRQASCFHIMAQDAANGDGVYPLTDGANYDAFCDMVTDGGGWTLIMKADGAQAQFDFDDALWENTTLLAEDTTVARNPDLIVGNGSGTTGESKLRSYLSVKVDELRVGFAPKTTGSRAFTFVTPNIALASTAASARAVFQGGQQTVASPARAQWLALNPAFRLQANCNLSAVNARKGSGGNRVRIGILGNEQNDCDSPDSFVGVGFSNTSTSAGNLATANGGGANDTNIPLHAAVLVRSDDLTDLGTRASCEEHQKAGFVGDGFYLVNAIKVFCDQP